MKTLPLGQSPLASSRLAYGCWRIAGTQSSAEVSPEREANARRALIAAYEAGFTLFDHADVYCEGAPEKIFGRVLREIPGMREKVLISSKCGIRVKGNPVPHSPYRYDFSAEHIVWSCEQSLQRLGVQTIDLYQLHRPDYLCQPEEVARAFAQLKAAGKVREFGVSNFRPSQVSMLQKYCPMKLVVNQVEISLARIDCFQDGVLDQCVTEKMTPLAWGPLAAGRLSDPAPIDLNSPDHVHRIFLRDTLDAIARERACSRTQVALAWLLEHPAQIIPIIGSTKPDNIRDAAQAVDLELTREEWYRLMEAAVGQRLP